MTSLIRTRCTGFITRQAPTLDASEDLEKLESGFNLEIKEAQYKNTVSLILV